MSEERELLAQIMRYFAAGDIAVKEFEMSSDIAETLHNAQELLAQPETKQEPVAWMYDWNTKGDELYGNSYYDRVSSDEMAIKRCACDNIRPLYTTPPKDEPPQTAREMYQRGYAAAERDLKRKPLSDTKCPYPEETSCEYRDGFTDGILYAEKHHKIGGKD